MAEDRVVRVEVMEAEMATVTAATTACLSVRNKGKRRDSGCGDSGGDEGDAILGHWTFLSCGS
jgi:hypothetical protein